MTTLFSDDLVLVTLGSGSRGNCTWVGDGRRGLLIDCGISTRQIRSRLAAAGFPDAPIDAVLITHEHSDHVAAAAILDRHLFKERGEHVPFFMTSSTHRRLRSSLRPTRVEHVRPGDAVPFHGWSLEPHAVPHDTPDPVAWAVDFRRSRVGVVTDLGSSTRLVAHMLASLDAAVLEFNHDETMLMDGPYPWQLKQRIKGRHGHLSNRQAAKLLLRANPERLRHLVLAHLSEENNAPERALAAAEHAVRQLDRPITIQVADQRVPTEAIIVTRQPVSRSPARRRGTSEEAAPWLQPSLFDGLAT